ncbi:MAG: helix-turn-helix transcriptional regulator [Deltaproteobacteria bacterium]
MSGPELLRKYLTQNGLTQEQFAAAAKVPGPQVSLWLSRARKPNLASAFKIEAATGGLVRATDWIPSKRRRAA